MSREVPQRRQDDLRRRLQHYADTWRDNDFLDDMCDWDAAGRQFTPAQADAIDEALARWQQRLAGPSYDPDRPPPGYDQHIWELATRFRLGMDARELACPSRREIYAELTRAIGRDKLRENHDPWRDKDGKPGWWRMLAAVTEIYTAHADPDRSMAAARDFAQPGIIAGIAREIIEDMMLTRFEHAAEPAQPYQPTPERRAAVRRYLQGR